MKALSSQIVDRGRTWTFVQYQFPSIVIRMPICVRELQSPPSPSKAKPAPQRRTPSGPAARTTASSACLTKPMRRHRPRQRAVPTKKSSGRCDGRTPRAPRRNLPWSSTAKTVIASSNSRILPVSWPDAPSPPAASPMRGLRRALLRRRGMVLACVFEGAKRPSSQANAPRARERLRAASPQRRRRRAGVAGCASGNRRSARPRSGGAAGRARRVARPAAFAAHRPSASPSNVRGRPRAAATARSPR
jgi:hypothetical protein